MDDVLKIAVVENAGTTVLKLSGDLDSYTSPKLSKFGRTWLKNRNKLVINLDDLDYIDSTGLSALVALWIITKEQGISMVVSCRSPRIHRVFELTGLLNLFDVVFTGRDGSASRTSISAGLDSRQRAAAKGIDEPANQPL